MVQCGARRSVRVRVRGRSVREAVDYCLSYQEANPERTKVGRLRWKYTTHFISSTLVVIIVDEMEIENIMMMMCCCVFYYYY